MKKIITLVNKKPNQTKNLATLLGLPNDYLHCSSIIKFLMKLFDFIHAIFLSYIKWLANCVWYIQKGKERLQKKALKNYQNFSKKEKVKSGHMGNLAANYVKTFLNMKNKGWLNRLFGWSDCIESQKKPRLLTI